MGLSIQKTKGLTFARWSGKDINEVGTDIATSKVLVKVNPKFFRTLESENLLGSPRKAEKILGWKRTYSFEALVEEMVLSDIELVRQGRIFSNTNLDWLVVGGSDIASNSSEGSPGPI